MVTYFINVPIPVNKVIKLVPKSAELASNAAEENTSSDSVVSNNDSNTENNKMAVDESTQETTTSSSNADVTKILSPAEAAANEQKRLEDLAIKAARTSATGKLIKSAEPFKFWEDPTAKPQGLRPLDLSVLFNIGWGVSSQDIVKFFNDLGYKTVEEAKKRIVEIGRYGKRITLTTVDKQTKKYIFSTISEHFSHKYKINAMEDDDVAVNLSSVPHHMTDEDIKMELKRYGHVDEIIHKKCDLGFPNNMRTVLMHDLDFDIPSYLKVKGYKILAKYHLQPETCRICNGRHMASDCPCQAPTVKVVVTESSKKQDPPAKVMHVPLTPEEDAIKTLFENTALLQIHPGSSVNTKQFQNLLESEANRLKDVVYKRYGKVVDLNKYRQKISKPGDKRHSSGYRDGYVDRRNGKWASYNQSDGNSDHQKWPRSQYDWQTVKSRNRGLKSGAGKSRADPDNYDFYDDPAGVSSSNKYDALRSDLRLSEDDYSDY